MKLLSTLFLLYIFLVEGFSTTVGPWNLDSLFVVPQWETTDVAAVAEMKSIFYKSIEYKGKAVDVYAYYSAPAGEAPEGGWPALVHVHGGGGTAFPEWVKAWNAHGYACISMDLEGHCPEKDELGSRIPTPNPGPSRVGIFDDWTLPFDEQWYFHAVAQIVKAHSLLRSFPEINSDKIGISGASWGGTLTSTVMGVDTRFCFAIPVYGSGYLAGSDGNQGTALPLGSAKTNFVNANYDGSAFFNNVTYPTLWFNGTNDNHFDLTCTQRSALGVQSPATLRYTFEMPHGNLAILKYAEPFAFADQVTKSGIPLAVIRKPQMSKGVGYVNFATENSIKSAEILYTLDDGSWIERVWKHASANISDTTIFAAIPTNATTIYFTATDERGLMVSSEYLSVESNENPSVNLALNGTASQSSTDFEGVATHAIDGNTNGVYVGKSVTHTTTEANPWWQVDLGAEKTIGDIIIYGRTDDCCASRLSNFSVFVFNSTGDTTYSISYNTYPVPSVTATTGDVQGKIIKVQLNDTNALSLAEVQVYSPGSFPEPVVEHKAPGPGDWSSVRLYGHAYNINDFSSAEYNWIKDHNWLFTIEKRHAKNIYGDRSSEYASDTTATKIILNNSNAKPLFYWNASVIYESIYETIHEALSAHPEWVRPDGKFNYKTAAFRDWWVSVPANEVINSAHSGVFIDAVQNVHAVMGIDTLRLLYKMLDQIPGIVIANGFWPQGSNLLAGLETLDYVDGIHVESFFQHVMDTKEEGKMVLDALLKVPDNKYIITNSKPDGVWGNDHQFSMACFLIIANDYSFYRYYFDGWSQADLMVWHDDFGKTLGKPLGKASVDGYVYTREFQYASVRVDLTKRTSSISWYDEPQDAVNLALKGTATQSSTSENGFASLAIDGNTLGLFEFGSVSNTAEDHMAWWLVDLGETHRIGDVTIFGRTDSCCNTRLSNFTLSVLDNENNIIYSKILTTFPDSSLTINAGGVNGRIIKIQMNTLSTALSLAEVHVFEQQIAVNGIRVSPSSKSMLIGDSLLLSVKLSPSDAFNKNVTWSSSDSAVATVDTSGLVIAVDPGLAIITATSEDGALSDDCSFTVYRITVSGIEISMDSVSLFVGDTILLSATVIPTNATMQNVSWSSSNNLIAAVDSTGLVRTQDTGSVTISVKTEDGGYTDKSVISVSALTTVNQYLINTYIQTISDCKGAEVEIYNVIGKLLSKHVLVDNEYKLEMNSFSSGIYIVRITNKGTTYTQKLYKQ